MHLVRNIKIISGQLVLITTDENQYKIWFDDWIKSKIKKDQKITTPEKILLTKNAICTFINQYCLKQILISQKSSFELRRKILNKIPSWIDKHKYEYKTEEIKILIDNELIRYEENKLIDDNKYVYAYINRSNKKSDKQIEYELKNKGIELDNIKQALKSREKDEFEIIRYYINKKTINKQQLSFNDRNKLIASLIRKGFSIDKVKSMIDERFKKK